MFGLLRDERDLVGRDLLGLLRRHLLLPAAKQSGETAAAFARENLRENRRAERANQMVEEACAVSVGILIGLGLAQAFDDEGGGDHRRRSKAAGAAGSLVGELSGLADAMLPTISGKVKELFGLDLAAYIHGAREQAARKRATKSIGAGTKKAASRKGTKTVGANKSGAAKKGGAAKRGVKTRKAG